MFEVSKYKTTLFLLVQTINVFLVDIDVVKFVFCTFVQKKKSQMNNNFS